MPFLGDMLVPWRVIPTNLLLNPYTLLMLQKSLPGSQPPEMDGEQKPLGISWDNNLPQAPLVKPRRISESSTVKLPTSIPSLITDYVRPRKTNG